MKYIVTENADTGEEEIFTFPNSVNHDVMAESIAGMRTQTWSPWKRVHRTPVSAGFIKGGKCEGESLTLNLKSREQDSKLL